MRKFSLIPLVAVLCACNNLPENRLSFNPATGLLEAVGHKDTKMQGVKVARKPDGSFSLEMNSYEATNSPANISAEAAGNAMILHEAGNLAGVVTQAAVKGAVQGAK